MHGSILLVVFKSVLNPLLLTIGVHMESKLAGTGLVELHVQSIGLRFAQLDSVK